MSFKGYRKSNYKSNYSVHFISSDVFTAKDYGSLVSFDSKTTKTAEQNQEIKEKSQARPPRQLPRNPKWKLNSNSFKSRNKSSFVSSAKDKSVVRKSQSFSGKHFLM